MSLGFQPDSFGPAFGPPESFLGPSVATLGGFQCGVFQQDAFQNVCDQAVVGPPAGGAGWTRKRKPGKRRFSRDEEDLRDLVYIFMTVMRKKP